MITSQHTLDSAVANAGPTRPGWMLPNGTPGAILSVWPKLMRDIGASDAHSVSARLHTALVKHKVALAVNTSQLSRSRIGGVRVGSYSSVEVHARLRFIANDGSWLTLEADGEAFDTSDSAVDKATAAAVQNALTHGLMLSGVPELQKTEPVPAALSAAAAVLAERIDAAADLDALASLMRSAETKAVSFVEQRELRARAVDKWTRLCRGMSDGPDTWPEPTASITLAEHSPPPGSERDHEARPTPGR